MGSAGRVRGRLVRHLQPGAQRSRAAPGRRHHRDAGQHRPDPDRRLRRAAARRGFSPVAGRRHRRRLRRCRPHRVATRSAETDMVGVVFCVIAALTYAAGVVAQKPLLRRLPGLQVTFMACATGAVCCLPWAGVLVEDLATAPTGSVVGMVYLGAVPTALAFSTWAYALRRMDAGRLGVTTYLVPPLVILLGWLLLDEVPPALALLGGAVCLAGVALSRRRGQVRPPVPVAQEAGSGVCPPLGGSRADRRRVAAHPARCGAGRCRARRAAASCRAHREPTAPPRWRGSATPARRGASRTGPDDQARA